MDSSIASLPSFCDIHYLNYTRISCCKQVALKTRPQISNILACEVHQNDCSYVNPGRPTVIGSLKFLTKSSQTCQKPKNLPKFTLFTWMMSGNMITHALINTRQACDLNLGYMLCLVLVVCIPIMTSLLDAIIMTEQDRPWK